MKLALSPVAIEDLERVGRFLEERNPTAAARASQLIREAMLSIGRMPGRGRIVPEDGARRLSVAFGRGAYIIDYRIDEDSGIALILRVRHSREAR